MYQVYWIVSGIVTSILALYIFRNEEGIKFISGLIIIITLLFGYIILPSATAIFVCYKFSHFVLYLFKKFEKEPKKNAKKLP